MNLFVHVILSSWVVRGNEVAADRPKSAHVHQKMKGFSTGKKIKNNNSTMAMTALPTNVLVVVGTYEGIVAGWELSSEGTMKIMFASPVHGGSVRSLSIAAASGNPNVPGALLSCGYDEYLKTHDIYKRMTSSGEIRTPAEFGTPVCSAMAPPLSTKSSTVTSSVSTHCLLGFAHGKIVIYKKRDWTVQHVLAGHSPGGVASLAVHPSGKLALSGGQDDGKLKLWDLTKGRLSYVSKIPPARTNIQGRTYYEPINSIVWTDDAYGFCYGTHVTVRSVATGEDLLDIEVPSKINHICFLPVEEGLFVVAACNDGSLPVLAVQEGNEKERKAILAIEPVEGPVAGEERFKCVQHLHGYHVVTANSAGVVSIYDLRGAVNMIMSSDDMNEATPVPPESDDGESDQELAVNIVDSVRLGTGARITCLAVCAHGPLRSSTNEAINEAENEEGVSDEADHENSPEDPVIDQSDKKRKRDVGMDPDAVARARALVSEAKKIQHRKKTKKQKSA